jgi:hypothetical protein
MLIFMTAELQIRQDEQPLPDDGRIATSLRACQ